MSALKDMVERDIRNTFLNVDEFGERRNVQYDGELYQNIPIVLDGIEEKDRQAHVQDHAQGLYKVTDLLFCSLDDLGGNEPEVGMKLLISTTEDGSFYHTYYVSASSCKNGMLQVSLEAINE